MTAPAAVDERALRELLPDPRNAGALADLLAPLPEAARKALAPVVRAEAERAPWSSRGRATLAVAVVGCCGPAQTVARLLRDMWVDPDMSLVLLRVLKDRSPRWLPGLPKALCTVDARRGAVVLRPLVRALVVEGLAPEPDDDLYFLGLPQDLARGSNRTPLEQFLADPGLLDDLWRLFLVEGSGRVLAGSDQSLAGSFALGVDDGDRGTIRHALLTLAAHGAVDRSRLLDETLAAMLRDWPAADLPWFAALHEALTPTVDETVSRESTLRRVLAAAAPAAVAVAQRRLTTLLDAGCLDVPAAVEASADVLLRPDVAPVKAQLTLLAAIAKAHPQEQAAVAEVVRLATEHPKPAVSERATSLLAKLGSAPAAVVTLAAPSVVRPPGGPLPPPAPDPVEPVETPDDLVDLLTRLVEEADDPVEVERALEALPRFARTRPSTRRTVLTRIGLAKPAEGEGLQGAEALARRCRALVGSYLLWQADLRLALATLTLSWLEKQSPGPAPTARGHEATTWDFFASAVRPRGGQDWTLSVLLGMRIHETAAITARGGGQVLSLPTHTDGSVSAAVLSQRLASMPPDAEPAPLDAGLAALRVPPSERSDVVLPAGHRAAAVVGLHLARLTQHVPRWEPVSGASPRPHADPLSPAVAWADAAAPQGGPTDVVGAVLDRRHPLDVLGYELTDGDYLARYSQNVGMWPLLVPHDADLLAAHGLGRFYRALTKDHSGTPALLAAIARAPRPVGRPACAALALALSARRPADRTSAVDALLDLTARGCLDGAVLGAEVVRFLTAGVTTGSRVAQALDEALTADPVLAHPLTDLAEVLLPALPGRKDAQLFVTVAGRAARLAGRGLALPEPFEALRGSSARSTLASACRSVPAT